MSTAGGEAADFAASIGYTLDPEQRLALDALLAERADGRWAATEGAVIAGRQNLKTLLFLVICFSDLYVFGAEKVAWTAHEFDTAKQSFQDVKDLIDANPHLSRRVSKINNANGEEGVEFRFPSGRRVLRFKARTKTGGRGLAGFDRIVLDEAFALQAAHMGSLMPILSAKTVTGNVQILYGSSAGMLTSEVLRTIRDRGRPGGDPGLVYVEWCAPLGGCANEQCDHRVGSVGCALDDPEKVRLANFALDRRISRAFVFGNERTTMTPTEFARERLGWWEDPETAGQGLPMLTWVECADRASKAASVEAFAVDAAPDLSWSAIGVAGKRSDGLFHLEVVEYRRGTDWIAARTAEIRAKNAPDAGVWFDEKGPLASHVEEFKESGVDLEPVSAGEFTVACGGLQDVLKRNAFRHLGQPELDMAARYAARQQAGDAWKWSRSRSDVEISPLVVITLALAGARAAEEETKPVFAY